MKDIAWRVVVGLAFSLTAFLAVSATSWAAVVSEWITKLTDALIWSVILVVVSYTFAFAFAGLMTALERPLGFCWAWGVYYLARPAGWLITALQWFGERFMDGLILVLCWSGFSFDEDKPSFIRWLFSWRRCPVWGAILVFMIWPIVFRVPLVGYLIAFLDAGLVVVLSWIYWEEGIQPKATRIAAPLGVLMTDQPFDLPIEP